MQRSEKPVYVPSSQSDMFIVDVPFKPVMNEDIKHMHVGLFNEESFNIFNPDPTPHSGKQAFNNDTKQNVKNIK